MRTRCWEAEECDECVWNDYACEHALSAAGVGDDAVVPGGDAGGGNDREACASAWLAALCDCVGAGAASAGDDGGVGCVSAGGEGRIHPTDHDAVAAGRNGGGVG